MRNIKELLQIVHSETRLAFESKDCYGLCEVNLELLHDRLFSKDEYYLVKDYLKSNLPAEPKEFENDYKLRGYKWQPGYTRPRLLWLTKQIKKL